MQHHCTNFITLTVQLVMDSSESVPDDKIHRKDHLTAILKCNNCEDGLVCFIFRRLGEVE